MSPPLTAFPIPFFPQERSTTWSLLFAHSLLFTLGTVLLLHASSRILRLIFASPIRIPYHLLLASAILGTTALVLFLPIVPIHCSSAIPVITVLLGLAIPLTRLILVIEAYLRAGHHRDTGMIGLAFILIRLVISIVGAVQAKLPTHTDPRILWCPQEMGRWWSIWLGAWDLAYALFFTQRLLRTARSLHRRIQSKDNSTTTTTSSSLKGRCIMMLLYLNQHGFLPLLSSLAIALIFSILFLADAWPGYPLYLISIQLVLELFLILSLLWRTHSSPLPPTTSSSRTRSSPNSHGSNLHGSHQRSSRAEKALQNSHNPISSSSSSPSNPDPNRKNLSLAPSRPSVRSSYPLGRTHPTPTESISSD
ncbi:MAG: hypothetical protein DHS80DRAFT_21317 [Piptocephalis tieghemiana]|nr:MAG: hypothetical protein DHS80DRAFT_21317 [Piptocephalis tieghemiana]